MSGRHGKPDGWREPCQPAARFATQSALDVRVVVPSHAEPSSLRMLPPSLSPCLASRTPPQSPSSRLSHAAAAAFAVATLRAPYAGMEWQGGETEMEGPELLDADGGLETDRKGTDLRELGKAMG
ncbi:hypothetical protein U9M48_007828 [Paspalum notatum var. saurae]|uniref:Uncharacterized protein n=1 Tax=Paspalum notatum var. saurae TaxID=547442 RepID=A0AAQ3WCG9_PASNO